MLSDTFWDVYFCKKKSGGWGSLTHFVNPTREAHTNAIETADDITVWSFLDFPREGNVPP